MPSQTPSASAHWPPPDTCLFQVYSIGVRPVLFVRALPGNHARVKFAKGFRVLDRRTGDIARNWTEVEQDIDLDDCFATRDDAAAEFQRRGGHPRCRRAA